MNEFQSQVLLYLQERSSAPDASHHWPLYRNSYISRPLDALDNSILERVSMLLGSTFLQTLLAEFLREEPPQHPIMVECLRGFSSWLRQKGWDDSRPELAALVDLSLKRWDVLIGPDPETDKDAAPRDESDLHFIFLQNNHAFVLSTLPIYDLWLSGDPEPGDQERWIPAEAQAVLFYKSSPITLETLQIPIHCVPFIQALSSGASLGCALQTMMEFQATEAYALESLPALLGHLQATGALEKKL